MLTLYNQFDPQVPSFNETRYRERVARRGRAGLLEQRLFAGRYGHAELFTPDEILLAFADLVDRAPERRRGGDGDRDRAVIAQNGKAEAGAGW
jgi:hypothetical protein